MFALVDCNNFYASCERVFNPKDLSRGRWSESGLLHSYRKAFLFFAQNLDYI